MDDTKYVAAYREGGITAVNRLLQAQTSPVMIRQLEALEGSGRWAVRFHHLSRQAGHIPFGMVVGFLGKEGTEARQAAGF